jgi:hypothetical protein
MYSKFNGREVVPDKGKNFRLPKKLIPIGKAHYIEYISDKLNGGGDGEPTIFMHKFKVPVTIYHDETLKEQLYMIGDKLKIGTAGIIN